MKKIFLLFVLAISVASAGYTQQEAQYSQYMFNGLLLNPAYAGSRDLLSATMLLRKQWVGIDGSPATQTISVHGPSRNLKSGFGFILWNDQLGVTRRTGLTACYAYRVQLGTGTLALGLQGGILNHSLKWSVLKSVDYDHGTPQTNTSALLPVAGTGIYYNTQRFYAGVATPNLFRTRYKNPNSVNSAVAARLERHLFATVGCVIPVSEDIDVKPSLVFKYVKNAPMEFDFNASVMFKRTFWVGASYRTGDAMVFIFEYIFKNKFRFGYAYDLTVSKLSGYNSGSHELMLGADIGNSIAKLKTPRFF